MNQHRAPETYWNQFCYLKGTARKLSVFKKGNIFTSTTTVKSFTREPDIFNISYLDKYPYALENAFRDIENSYQIILDKLNTENSILDDDKHKLICLMSSLLSRSKSNIRFIKNI